MKDDYVTREESNLSLKSIAESGRITTECLQTLTKSIQEIKEYIIHNDYRHTANETEIRDIKRKSEKKIHYLLYIPLMNPSYQEKPHIYLYCSLHKLNPC